MAIERKMTDTLSPRVGKSPAVIKADAAESDRPKLPAWHQLKAKLQERLALWLGPKDPGSESSRSYRYLARQIEADLPATSGGRLMLLSSPAAISTTSEALLMFSHFMRDELGCRILLIDGTFREGGVGAVLGFDGAPGFLDLVYGRAHRPADVIIPTQRQGISVLPAGRVPLDQLQPIQTDRISEIFDAVRASFDYVILQQASIYEDTRYLLFAGKADLVLLLVEEGVTLVEDLDRSMEVFRGHQIPNVRLVLSAPA